MIGLMLLLLGIIVAILLGLYVTRDRKHTECTWSEYRLPKWILPQAYRVHLDVEMTEPYVVKGDSEIAFAVVKSTRCVILHAKHMTVSSAFIADTLEQGEVLPLIR